MSGSGGPGNRWEGAKSAARKLAILLAALAVAFGLGFYRGRLQLGAVRSESLAREKDAEGRAAEAQTALRAARGAEALATASVFLYQSVLHLDERNFGTADAALREAAARLASVDATAAGVDPARLQALRQEVENTSVSLAADLNTQRAALAALAHRAASLLGAGRPGGTHRPPGESPAQPSPSPPGDGASPR